MSRLRAAKHGADRGPASRPATPGFVGHVLLLLRLRLAIAANRSRGEGVLLSVAPLLVAAAPALPLSIASWKLLAHPEVVDSALYSRLFLALLGFVGTSVWCAWPVLAAGVDDHSEVSRYAAFPISTLRLFTASLVADVAQPLAVVVFAPVIAGAASFLVHHPPASWAAAAFVLGCWLAFTLAWGRVGLHLVLLVLRQRRSAEAIGGFFVVVLGLSTLLPPIDTSWLAAAVGSGVSAIDSGFLVEAVVGLSLFPTGYLGNGLVALVLGKVLVAVANGLLLLFFAGIGVAAAYLLLLRFEGASDRSGIPSVPERSFDPFARSRTAFRALVVREALDLWRNPKARLLCAVPFLLAIALRLFAARDLVVHFRGACADAWFVGGLSLYGAVVFAASFVQNQFGYDGRALGTLIAAPLDLGLVLRARNLVHGAAAAAIGLGVVLFYRAYFHAGSAADLALAVAALLCCLPVLLAAGNFLSVCFPVRFHVSLQRRDEPPVAATVLGIGAAGVGAAPFGLVLQQAGEAAPGWAAVGHVAAAAAAAWLLYWLVLPRAEALLRRRSEAVLLAVSSD